jgi:zinc transport system substrate-binding protein
MPMRLYLLLLSLLWAGTAHAGVAVSILPLQAWVTELTGDDVQVLVGPGQSPALFEPTGRQLVELAGADVFFAIGVPFEIALVPRLKRMFPDLEIVVLGEGIERMAWPEVEEHGHVHDLDPHVWLDPSLAARIVAEMASVLQRRDPDRAEEIDRRSREMQQTFQQLDERLRARLEPLKGQALLAYHPALGYFARAYGLEQLAVESGGTEPGARHLAALGSRMDAQALRVLIIEPQFAPHRARSVAGSLGLEVLVFDPLSTDLVAELESLSDKLIRAGGDGTHP